MTHYISKIRPDTISIYVCHFRYSPPRGIRSREKPETEVLLSSILMKNRRKRPKIAENRPTFREFEAPANSGGLSDVPACRFDSEYAECPKLGLQSKMRNWQLENIAVVCKRAMKIPALVDRL